MWEHVPPPIVARKGGLDMAVEQAQGQHSIAKDDSGSPLAVGHVPTFQAVSSVVYSVVLHAAVSWRSAAAVSGGTITVAVSPAELRPPAG